MQRTQVRVSRPVGVDVRPARLDDRERVREFLLGLSLATQTQRFFAGMTRPSARVLQTLVARDERRDALLAVTEERVIGHAMAYRDGPRVEIAVVVADEWQNLGIGSRLVRTLLRRHAAAETLTMDVLGGNRRVLDMIHRAWPKATMTVESGSVQVSAELIFAEQGSVGPPLTV
ncbi:GNAT family N-acetyltransferase [Acrocarpospora catenulata]|uniref:GNAT family N-acetyltransferase n=1 Tax=Acrocarpospora catenulata TaxID=2836182 RepID=UPI001BD9C714|nr:GNAT family N-acetyltransferase [Acrocarpospora catenulata]